ncbi:MAG: FMN-binding protein [Endomicrobiia bacterium]
MKTKIVIKFFLIFFIFLFINIFALSEDIYFEKFVSSYILVNNQPKYYYLTYENDKITGFFIESADWTNQKIRGYGGDINLQIYFSLDGKIKNIKVIEQYETKKYAKDVFEEKYLSQYYNKDNKSKFILGDDIKAISGATISCNAVNEIIYQCVNNVHKYIIGEKILKKDFSARIPKTEILKTITLWILFFVSIFGFLYNLKILRYIIMFFTIFFLGIIYKGGLSFGHIQNFIYFNFPSVNNIFIWSLIILTFVTTLFFGRLFCGWLCPFGAVIELLFDLKTYIEKKYKKTLGKEIELEIIEDNEIVKFLRKYESSYRYVKYFLLITILILPSFIIIEPFQYIFYINQTELKFIIYLLFILILCIIFVRLWCRYLCPLGAFLCVFSKISFFKLQISQEHCFNCEICKTICPTNAIIEKNDKLKILNTECILCNKCRQNCGPQNIKIVKKLKY